MYNKEYRKKYYLKNKEKIADKQRKYYEERGTTNYALFGKKWYEKNKEKNLERSRKWQRNNRKRTVKIVQAYVKRNKEKVQNYLKRYEQTKAALFRTTLSNAKRRGYEFSLSFEDFDAITSRSCFYCGENEKRIGIDRIDNSIGYTKENSVSCCKICNYMKRTMTKEDFLNHIKKIYLWITNQR